MVVLLFILISMLGVIKKKSKIVFWAMCLLMWMTATFSYGNADENFYIARYNGTWSGSTEIIYNLLILWCNKLGMSFVEFKGVSFFLSILLTGSTVWQFAKYPNFVLSLFFLCPFPMYVTQMRSGLATAVFVFGIRYLLCEEVHVKSICFFRKKFKFNVNDIKYIFCVLIATFIHTQSLMWLVLIVAKKCSTKLNIWITILSNFLLLFIITPENIVKILSIFGAGGRMSAYLSREYANSDWRHYGVIINVLFVATVIFFFCWYISKKPEGIYCKKDALKLTLNINISILCILAIIIRYTSEISRLQEGMIVINYLLLTNVMKSENLKLRRLTIANCKVLIITLVLLIGLLWLLILHYLVPTVWNPFWFNNTLLSF